MDMARDLKNKRLTTIRNSAVDTESAQTLATEGNTFTHNLKVIPLLTT